MTKRNHLSLSLLVFIGWLGGCGDRQVTTTEVDWDRQPTTVVAAKGTAGGYVPQMTSFIERDYGSPFVRLMGDGKLFYGGPTAVKLRQLDEAEVEDLLQQLHPDRFQGYEEHYNAGMATDLPTTTIAVDVKPWGTHKVDIYGLSGGASDTSEVPDTLLAAAKALGDAAAGGSEHTPSRIRLGAEQIDLQQYTQIDAGAVQDWPVSGVDLSQASIYANGGEGLKLAGPQQVAAVVALLQIEGENLWPDASVVFRQAGETYWVAYATLLP